MVMLMQGGKSIFKPCKTFTTNIKHIAFLGGSTFERNPRRHTKTSILDKETFTIGGDSKAVDAW